MSDNGNGELSAIDIVDELEEMVSTARRVPLSANVIVNEDETLELIDRLRMGLPEELVQARHTVEDRARIVGAAEEEAEHVLSRADQEATRLVQEATERAQAMVTESVITQQAHARAAEIVAKAEERAASIRGEADAYARDVMTRLEEQLTRAAATVRKGIETLPGPSGVRRRRREGGIS
jgi:vacuolar-type H+-ATPase subunit H